MAVGDKDSIYNFEFLKIYWGLVTQLRHSL